MGIKDRLERGQKGSERQREKAGKKKDEIDETKINI